jgi:hypothetical protein
VCYLCVVSYCSTTATGKNAFTVKIYNKIINNNKCYVMLIVCSVSFIVCVVLCAMFCLSVVCYLCVVSYCSTTATGKNAFAVKIHNKIINNNKFHVMLIVCSVSFIVCVVLCAKFCLSVVRYFV